MTSLNSGFYLSFRMVANICERDVDGGSGLRTHVTVSRKHAFQACAFSHSATPPDRTFLNAASLCHEKFATPASTTPFLIGCQKARPFMETPSAMCPSWALFGVAGRRSDPRRRAIYPRVVNAQPCGRHTDR